MTSQIPAIKVVVLLNHIAENGNEFRNMATRSGNDLRADVDFAISQIRKMHPYARAAYGNDTIENFRAVWLAAYDDGLTAGYSVAQTVNVNADPIVCE